MRQKMFFYKIHTTTNTWDFGEKVFFFSNKISPKFPKYDHSFSAKISWNEVFLTLWVIRKKRNLTKCSHFLKIQLNSVKTNSTGPSIFVRKIRDVVITVRVYIIK